MRIYKAGIALGLGLVMVAGAAADAPAALAQKHGWQANYQAGMKFLQARKYREAAKYLKAAADAGDVKSKFFLARIYARNDGPLVDHAKAFHLYEEIATDHREVDPYESYSAIYVAQSYVEVAQYLRSGVPQAKEPANPAEARNYLEYAATYFAYSDAQFELARMFLDGEGGEVDVPRGLDWLSNLASKGHAGAQAQLALLFWTGKHVAKLPVRAVALVTLAMENSSKSDAIWIGDIYHQIYCSASSDVRGKATILLDVWRERYAPSAPASPDQALLDEVGLGLAMPDVVRECANGELIRLPRRERSRMPKLRRKGGGAGGALSVEETKPAEPGDFKTVPGEE